MIVFKESKSSDNIKDQASTQSAFTPAKRDHRIP